MSKINEVIFTTCPYLKVNQQDLQDVKEDYRERVTEDAEKCTGSKCSSFVNGKCTKRDKSIFDVKLGKRGYKVPKEWLKENTRLEAFI